MHNKLGLKGRQVVPECKPGVTPVIIRCKAGGNPAKFLMRLHKNFLVWVPDWQGD